MNQKTFKRISVLSLVLLGASAVTAAILPKHADNKLEKNGLLLGSPDTTDARTCTFAEGADDCSATVSATTTAGSDANESTVTSAGGQDHTTVNNSSDGVVTSATAVV